MIARIPPAAFLLPLFFCSIQCKGSFSPFSSPRRSHVELATEYAERGETERAAEEYLTHIRERLRDRRRPKEENPYFYHLLIGDLYRQAGKPEEAKEHYLTAREQGVDTAFVVDRLRLLGRWYASHERYQEALELAEHHRELDPSAFDADIDEFHKALVEKEDSQ